MKKWMKYEIGMPSQLGELFGWKPVRDVCKNRHRGNAESEAAFKHIRDALTESQERVYRAIKDRGERGLTNDELCIVLGLTPNQVSPRLTELKIDGWIERCGTRPTRSGCAAAVWKSV